MFDKFMLVWLDGNFSKLAWNLFHQKYSSFSISRFMLQLLFVVIDQPAFTIQIYSNIFHSLPHTTFLLVFRCCVFLHGVIIFRQQMRWKFLMVSRGNYLQLFSELFQSFHWSSGSQDERRSPHLFHLFRFLVAGIKTFGPKSWSHFSNCFLTKIFRSRPNKLISDLDCGDGI